MNQNNKLPILLPNEIIDIIISYRNIHPLSMIIKNEYINIFNKKYKNYLKKMFNDLTNGINRANHFFYRGEEDINIQDDDERSINNDDNILRSCDIATVDFVFLYKPQFIKKGLNFVISEGKCKISGEVLFTE
jgi:hypothetical protein